MQWYTSSSHFINVYTFSIMFLSKQVTEKLLGLKKKYLLHKNREVCVFGGRGWGRSKHSILSNQIKHAPKNPIISTCTHIRPQNTEHLQGCSTWHPPSKPMKMFKVLENTGLFLNLHVQETTMYTHSLAHTAAALCQTFTSTQNKFEMTVINTYAT